MADPHHHCNTDFGKPEELTQLCSDVCPGTAAFRAIVRLTIKVALTVYPKQHIFRPEKESYVSKNEEFAHYL